MRTRAGAARRGAGGASHDVCGGVLTPGEKRAGRVVAFSRQNPPLGALRSLVNIKHDTLHLTIHIDYSMRVRLSHTAIMLVQQTITTQKRLIDSQIVGLLKRGAHLP